MLLIPVTKEDLRKTRALKSDSREMAIIFLKEYFSLSLIF